MTGIGHNSGHVNEPGQSWRRHAWRKARKALLPDLPVEVVRLRVKRAKALGLPYRTYAGIRASTGHDLIGFLFSSNALHILRDGDALPTDRARKLGDLHQTRRVGIVHKPVSALHLSSLAGIDAAFAGPSFDDPWSVMRDRIKMVVKTSGAPADRFLMIGDTAFEREWASAGQMAGYLPASHYFEGWMDRDPSYAE
ncbi:hypothetical protein [Yoonia sp. SS1-5]|uniref:Uncharacterized protein n=1 Tax=Yoonia rhodophyticola TaxID=3137370 RepID=A0AAN0NKA8_9RHOB